MRSIFLLICLPLILFGCSSMSSIDTGGVTCRIIQRGLVGNDTWKKESRDPRTTSGIIQEHIGINIYKETTIIPLKKNISFGVKYEFTGLKEGELVTQVIHHPLILKPDGTQSTGYSKEKEPGVGTSYILNRSYELVPGMWSFEYWYKNIKLCGQEFELRKT